MDRVGLADDERLAEAHAELERVGEALLVLRHRLDRAAVGLQVGLEPVDRLARRVDDQRRLRRVEDDETDGVDDHSRPRERHDLVRVLSRAALNRDVDLSVGAEG